VRITDDTKALQGRIDWSKLRDLCEIEPLAARAAEVLKGARAAGLDDFFSPRQLHEIIRIQAGKRYSSTPSNIRAALRNFSGFIEKRQFDCLKFRFPEITNGQTETSNPPPDHLDNKLVEICERFHRAIVHLSHRRRGRAVINFSDEYDVQDVFGTVLKCSFDDVRDEEWTPSYAARAGRIDFIIADVRTATELKRARSRQQIDEELMIDIERYAKRADVDRLVCYVYDPDGFLRRDAAQIEKDLSGARVRNGHTLDVIVLIRPK
jgi:REase_DpnII-MboI